jgi:hypothetical protein
MKFTLKKHVTTLALAATVSFTAALSAQAQLIAYDGMDYGDNVWLGNTASLSAGGFGWGGAWTTGGQNVATNYATGLQYTDGTYSLQTSGGSAIIGSAAGFTGTQQLQRNLNASFTNRAAGSVWISFLYQNLNANQSTYPGFRQANIGLYRGATTNASGATVGGGTETVDVGAGNTYTGGVPSDKMSLWGASPVGQPFAQQSTLATPRGTGNNPVFVVMELVTDGTAAADTVYAWFNPSLGSAPLTSTAISTNVWFLEQINSIKIQAGNANANGTNSFFAFDELRVGYSFADVAPVPEPAIFGLAAVGGLMFLALRRKK